MTAMLKSTRIVPVPQPFGGAWPSIQLVMAAESGATGALVMS